MTYLTKKTIELIVEEANKMMDIKPSSSLPRTVEANISDLEADIRSINRRLHDLESQPQTEYEYANKSNKDNYEYNQKAIDAHLRDCNSMLEELKGWKLPSQYHQELRDNCIKCIEENIANPKVQWYFVENFPDYDTWVQARKIKLQEDLKDLNYKLTAAIGEQCDTQEWLSLLRSSILTNTDPSTPEIHKLEILGV